jgi:hypothetical protein
MFNREPIDGQQVRPSLPISIAPYKMIAFR